MEMSKKEKVSQYRSMELLDSIFSVIYGDDVWLLEDLDDVRKMYRSCHALLNAPEKPWQEYEKEMKKFDKQLKKFVAQINLLKGDQS
jgi:hypothetical protein